MTLWRERIRSPSVGRGWPFLERGEPVEQSGALERLLNVLLGDVVLVEQNDHLVGVLLEEVVDDVEEVDHPRGAELAQRVAQVDVPLAAGRGLGERPGHALECQPRDGRELGGDAVEAVPFGDQIGVDGAAAGW